jgi:hypothetical protein
MDELDDAGTRSVVAIHRLQAAYGDAVTRRAWADVRALFEPDAVVELDLRTGAPIVLGGPVALTDFVEQAVTRFRFFELSILNAVVDVDGDAATGRLYICELRHTQQGEWSQAYGLYRDDYRRREGSWRIAGRRYSSLARTGPTLESFELP